MLYEVITLSFCHVALLLCGAACAASEQEWRDFTIKFPLSPQLAQAVLYQARALVEEGKYRNNFV